MCFVQLLLCQCFRCSDINFIKLKIDFINRLQLWYIHFDVSEIRNI